MSSVNLCLSVDTDELKKRLAVLEAALTKKQAERMTKKKRKNTFSALFDGLLHIKEVDPQNADA